MRDDNQPSNYLTFSERSDSRDTHNYCLRRIFYVGQTSFQAVCIAETANYGKTLFLDGMIQSAVLDQELYHELLVQPAMLAHPTPKHVLVIGGGEGATIWQVLRHQSLESLTMVDIDGELIRICREHMKEWHRGAFEDPRCRIIPSDGRAFIENDQSLYDVVIIDLSDLVSDSPALALYTREFYLGIKERLKPGGIVGVQALRFSFDDGHAHAMLARTLKSIFNEVHSYSAFVPSFLRGWGFLVASDWFVPADLSASAMDSIIAKRINSSLSHLTGAFFQSCFIHCAQAQKLLASNGPIFEDGKMSDLDATLAQLTEEAR
ncbi:hypothetical protein I6F35_37575 [Bradyrhizobium sp. BRP22]|uniref:spermine/spermidine synthase domain-containing protein n=1 Tax=Bradyrhizobium sp. BRP22 TaxID=2793821 RepID=UPI001CD23F83|nr:hypothetical protein [Bradyrhizobium sp. BRP22]